MTPFLTLREAAEYLRISPRTLSRLYHQGKVKGRRHGAGRGRIVFHVEDLCRYSDESLEATKKVAGLSRFQEARLRLIESGSLTTEHTGIPSPEKGVG